MKGRILIDVPQTGHTCGEYVDIDKNTANALINIGAFDPHAPWPEATEPQPAALRKRRGKPSPQAVPMPSSKAPPRPPRSVAHCNQMDHP